MPYAAFDPGAIVLTKPSLADLAALAEKKQSSVIIFEDSFESLERLILQSVRPKDLDLSTIARMTHLKDVDIGGVPEFTIEHYARLAAALPNAEGRCLQPYFEIKNLAFCKKCKAGMVMLNGTPPRARKWLCPKCNQKKLAEHVRAWESFKNAR